MFIRNNAILVVVFAALALQNLAQDTAGKLADQNRVAYRKLLRSHNIQDRITAVAYFSRLSREEIGKDLMNELVEFIVAEPERWKEANKASGSSPYAVPSSLYPGGIDTEGDWFLLYLEKIFTIAGKSGDIRTLPFLIEYFAPPKQLVGFGEEAVAPYFEALHRPGISIGMKAGYLRVLGYWISGKKEGYNPEGKVREKIKRELITSATQDTWYWVRLEAAIWLAQAPDEDLLPIFERIASNDPWNFQEGIKGPTDKIPAPGKKVLRYPLREIARAELEKRRKSKTK
jgi:hypothetical protein